MTRVAVEWKRRKPKTLSTLAPRSANANPTATTKTLWSTLFKRDFNIAYLMPRGRGSIRQRPSHPMFRSMLVKLHKYSLATSQTIS